MKLVNDLWLDVRRFAANAQDLHDWNYAKTAPYLTELKNRQTFDFFQNAFGYLLGAGIRGCYQEYGCYSARTFRIALSEACKFGFDEMQFWAFDSFSGLPEPELKPSLASWSSGAMAMSRDDFLALIHEQGVNADKVYIVEGFYEDTLTRELQQKLQLIAQPIALLNIDCDLRESAASVLSFIPPLIQDGTLVYIDDWFCGYGGKLFNGVAGAFHEFLEINKLHHDLFAIVGYWGKAFVVYR